MKDPAFIQQMFTRAREAGEKVGQEISGLGIEQINWKPAPETWSIGQCLDHLIVSDSLYFPAFDRLASGKFSMTWWQNWNPFSNLFAKMLISQTGEKVNKRLKAPRVFVPSAERADAGIVDRFQKHLDTLTHYVGECRNTDLDKVHITSPVSKVITYSLRSAILIIVQHEHRHVNQAIRVKHMPAFPS
jgi:hypothetical protein